MPTSQNIDDLPEEQRKGLPRYPVPVALPGRLAVAESYQGNGVGSILLADALERIVKVNQVMAVHAVTVDALNDRVAEFYQRRDFTPMPDRPLKLYLTIDSVATLLD